MSMKRSYIPPRMEEVRIEFSTCICTSYDTLSISGKAEELDASRHRGWIEYEGY